MFSDIIFLINISIEMFVDAMNILKMAFQLKLAFDCPPN